MFLLNSRLGLLTAAPAAPVSLCAEASLFPRLRDYFAEFLNVVSLAHLGLLDPSTCVGLRYGPARSDATATFLGFQRTGFASAEASAPACATPNQQGDPPSGRVIAFARAPGAGMFACSPSATPFGLALGPG